MGKDKKKEVKAEELVEEVIPEPAEAAEETPEVNEWEEKYNAERDAHLNRMGHYRCYFSHITQSRINIIP